MKINYFKFSLFFLVLFANPDLYAQKDTLVNAKKFLKKSTFPKRELEILDQAELFYEEGDYTSALPLFLMLEKDYTGEVLYKYRLGECYLYKPNEHNKAIEYLKLVEAEVPDADNINYNLGHAYFLNYEFDKAIEQFNKAIASEYSDKKKKEKAIKFIRNCNSAKELMEAPKNYLIVNLDSNINTGYSEYAPVFFGKNKMLLYTFRGDTNILNNRNTPINPMYDYYEDVYVAYSLNASNNSWTKPYKASGKINSAYHDASVSSSPDGKKFYVYRNLSKGNNGDIYQSVFENGSLSEPIFLDKINTKNWEGSVTTDVLDKVMIFSSERPDGIGGKDLYKSVKDQDGKWGTPVNIGNVVNTADNEDGPLLSPDGKFLYFSSEGHNSMGGYDIFKVEVKEDGSFGKPENLGYPVNSLADDIYIFIPLDDERLYFSSSRGGAFGMMDIYYFQKPKKIETVKLIDVQGLITSEKKSMESTISVYFLNPVDSSMVLQGIYHTNVFDGSYHLPLLSGQTYDIKVVADYANKGDEELVDLTKQVDRIYTKNISVDEAPVILASNERPIPAPVEIVEPVAAAKDATATTPAKDAASAAPAKAIIKPVILDKDIVYVKRVYFDFNRASVPDSYYEYLNTLAVLMNNNKNTNITIAGHTDGWGTEEFNKDLSLRRAKLTRVYLMSKGIAGNRIKAEGKGESELLVPDKNGRDRSAASKNRRVEFKIYTPKNFNKQIKYEQ